MSWTINVTNPPPPTVVVEEGDVVQVRVANTTSQVVKVISQGPQGIQGIQGPPGATTGDLHHVHTQSTPADTWTVSHSLNKFPSVSIVDSANEQVFGDVDYLDLNRVVLSFSAAFSGQAFFN